VRPEGLGKFEKIHLIGTRSRDLPACRNPENFSGLHAIQIKLFIMELFRSVTYVGNVRYGPYILSFNSPEIKISPMLKIAIPNSEEKIYFIFVLNLIVYLDWLFIYPKCIENFSGKT
jgi:hypothetical protein